MVRLARILLAPLIFSSAFAQPVHLQKVTITYATRTGTTWPLYIAMEAGYFHKYGLEANIVFGVHPAGKTLWVTSIPQNAVFVYSLADLKLLGQIDLPDLKLTGYPLGGAVANWVTFTPDGSTIYIANSGLRSVTAIDTKAMKVKAVIPVGEVPKRINTLVMN